VASSVLSSASLNSARRRRRIASSLEESMHIYTYKYIFICEIGGNELVCGCELIMPLKAQLFLYCIPPCLRLLSIWRNKSGLILLKSFEAQSLFCLFVCLIGFRRPNLITGLSRWRTPDYFLVVATCFFLAVNGPTAVSEVSIRNWSSSQWVRESSGLRHVNTRPTSQSGSLQDGLSCL